MIPPSRRLTLPPGSGFPYAPELTGERGCGVGAETDYHLLCSRGPEGRGRGTLGVAPGAAVVKAAGRLQQLT